VGPSLVLIGEAFACSPVELLQCWQMSVQVELFWGTEIVDDSLSLVDVAYIYVMKKVRQHILCVCCALSVFCRSKILITGSHCP